MKKVTIVILAVIMNIVVTGFIAYIGMTTFERTQTITKEEFISEIKTTIDESVIGTDVTLWQTLIGERSTQYRYKLNTNCTYWVYEDALLLPTELDWVPSGENSVAAQTFATEYTIVYKGDVVAKEHYLSIPILDLTVPKNTDIDTWKESVVTSTYLANVNAGELSTVHFVAWALFILVLGVILITVDVMIRAYLMRLGDPVSKEYIRDDEYDEEYVEDSDDEDDEDDYLDD